MTIVAAESIREMAQALMEATLGEVVRQVDRVTREQIRYFKEVVLQEVIRLSLDQALGPSRRRQKPDGIIPWSCPRCGPRRADQVRRNGTYERSPLTREGPIRVRIPQLVCQDCLGAVPFSLPCLPRWRRLWGDVEQEIVRAYLGGHSYRTIASQVATGLGLMTAWRTLQRAAEGTHQPPPTPQLQAVGLDEFHVRVRGRPAWFLVSRGATLGGGGHYLGAVLSEDRSQASWELALDALGVSSLSPEIPLIADGDAAVEAAVARCLPGRRLGRCAWHILHNAAQWLQERLPSPEQEGQRRGLLAAAQAVVNAPTPKLRRRSLAVLNQIAPWLAARLHPLLDRVGYPDAQRPRTNNVCERGFREWRRRTRPMDGFGSWQGAKNFARLWMLKENARAQGQDWMEAIMP